MIRYLCQITMYLGQLIKAILSNVNVEHSFTITTSESLKHNVQKCVHQVCINKLQLGYDYASGSNHQESRSTDELVLNNINSNQGHI